MRVLVLGATGTQGGGVARCLLDAGVAVRAITRDPDGMAAARLSAAGVEIVRGDLQDRASLRAALRGCDRVFGSTACWRARGEEAIHGRNLINAVSGAEVEHLVFSTLLPELEAYALSLELPATLLRLPLAPDAPTPGVVAAALGAAVLTILRAPADYLGRTLDLEALVDKQPGKRRT